MFKISACFFLVAVAVSNAYVISDSVNEGSNVNSVNSDVAQTGIQNVGVVGPFGGAASMFPIYGGLSPIPSIYRLPMARIAPYVPRYQPVAYPGWASPAAAIVSASSNLGTNVGSTGSNVNQGNVQNVNSGYGYYALV